MVTGRFLHSDRDQVVVALEEGRRFRLRLLQLDPVGLTRYRQFNWGEAPDYLFVSAPDPDTGLEDLLIASGNRLTRLRPDPEGDVFAPNGNWTFASPVQMVSTGDLDGEGSSELIVTLTGSIQEALDMEAVPEVWVIPGDPEVSPHQVPVGGIPVHAEVFSAPVEEELSVAIAAHLPSPQGLRTRLGLYYPSPDWHTWSTHWEGILSARPLAGFRLGSVLSPAGTDLVALEEEGPDTSRLVVYHWAEAAFLRRWTSDAARETWGLEVADGNGDNRDEVLLLERSGADRVKILVYAGEGEHCVVRYVSDALPGVQAATWGDVDGDLLHEIVYCDAEGTHVLEWVL